MKLLETCTMYIRASAEEFKKISWSSKKDTTKYTYAVIGLSLGLALFFGIIDYLLNGGFTFLLRFK